MNGPMGGMTRGLVCGIGIACALFAPGCSEKVPSDVAASVNGRAVTYQDLDNYYRYYRRQFGDDESKVSPEQQLSQRLEVLRTLIDSEIMLQRAEKQSLIAVDADVDARFNELKAPYTEEEFKKWLSDLNITVEQMRAQIRRDLSIQRLFNKEITSHITITDAEVKEFFETNRASFNLAEPRIHLAQIAVTPHPDPNVRNLKNDKAQSLEDARRKIKMIEARLQNGEDFSMLAQNYSEDPNSTPNGGDMGFLPESAFRQAPIELRQLIFDLKPGQHSPIIATEEGFRILKVIAKEPAGQRDLNDPRVQQTIRETLLNRKDQLLKAAYYEVARNEADVRNYFALRITETKGKLE
jgi:peptidyl-prolyl cis-trans isomerase SurA